MNVEKRYRPEEPFLAVRKAVSLRRELWPTTPPWRCPPVICLSPLPFLLFGGIPAYGSAEPVWASIRFAGLLACTLSAYWITGDAYHRRVDKGAEWTWLRRWPDYRLRLICSRCDLELPRDAYPDRWFSTLIQRAGLSPGPHRYGLGLTVGIAGLALALALEATSAVSSAAASAFSEVAKREAIVSIWTSFSSLLAIAIIAPELLNARSDNRRAIAADASAVRCHRLEQDLGRTGYLREQ